MKTKNLITVIFATSLLASGCNQVQEQKVSRPLQNLREKLLTSVGSTISGKIVDIRKDSLEYAKRKVNSTKLYLVRGDARQLPIIESSFDGASCASSFSFYDQDLEQASNEVYRALKDGGLFALTGMEMRTHFIQGGEQMIRDVEKSYRRGELTTDDMIRATSFDPLQITPDGAVDCSERTKEALEKAGFRIKKLKHFNDGVGYFILVEKCS